MTSAKSAGDARISTLEGQGKVDTDKISALLKQVGSLELQAKKDNDEINANRLRLAELEGTTPSSTNAVIIWVFSAQTKHKTQNST